MSDQTQEAPAPESQIDLTKLPEIQHHWIKRGIKMSCEGAGHPHHSHYLIGAVRT